jgi:hypothetical protein
MVQETLPAALTLQVAWHQVERFWDAVDASGDCWIYGGRHDRKGYGRVAFTIAGEPRQFYAHRFAWLILIGDLEPADMTLDHRCRVPACVNPAHLYPETRAANSMLGHTPPARNRRATECLRGHVFSPENTRVDNFGSRRCRECDRARKRRTYQEKASRRPAGPDAERQHNGLVQG